jgi:capsular polysaccharide transport system permease protein
MASALGNQFRVLGALVGRELNEKLSKGGSTFAFGVLEPMFQIGLVTAWFSMLRLSATYGTSIALFTATGIFPYYVFVLLSLRFRRSARIGASANRLAQETTLDLMIAQAFVQMVIYLFAGVVLFAAIYFWDTPQAIPHDWGKVFKALFALTVFGFGFGLCSAAISLVSDIWQHIWPAFSRLMLMLSGIFFVVDFLPLYLRDVLQWNPLVHCLTMFRLGFYPSYPTFVYSEAMVWGPALGILALGLCLQRVFRRWM